MSRKVVVTGGAGFVGRALVRRLLANGDDVTVLDDFSNSARFLLPGGAKVVAQDVSCDALALQNTDVCFHLACQNIIESVKKPKEDLLVNALGTMRVMQALPDSARVVYTSSASVYGDGEPPYTENSPLRCKTPYSISKLAGEGYTLLYKPHATVLRLSNVYGPGQAPGVGVINRFFEVAERGEPLPVHGDGTQTRDFTYIDDIVDALLIAAEKQNGGIYNVGTGIPTSIFDLAQAVQECFGKSLGTASAGERPMLDSIRKRSVDSSLALSELGWKAKTGLVEGLRRWRASCV